MKAKNLNIINLEKVWKTYHQKSVDYGEKIGWSVWKRTPENDTENAAHYVVFNQFSKTNGKFHEKLEYG